MNSKKASSKGCCELDRLLNDIGGASCLLNVRRLRALIPTVWILPWQPRELGGKYGGRG